MNKVFDRIEAFNKGRIPETVALKYQLMAMDSFRFFRGTCHLFYKDLSKQITWKDETKAWICGDLHLENFGSYKGDNRVVYFDINDYDESILAPASWELVRFLTSIHVAAHVLGLTTELAGMLCKDGMEQYLTGILSGKALAVEKETASGLLKDFLKKVALRTEKELIEKRVDIGRMKIILIKDKYASLNDKEKVMLEATKWFTAHHGEGKVKIHDAAERIAGTGSLGLKRYVVLKEDLETGALHLVDIKEATPSSLLPYVKTKQPNWENEAERIKILQKRCQYVPPAWLHTLQIGKVHFVIKELQPVEDKMDLTLCQGKPKRLANIISTMAQLMASEQLRSSGRQASSTADELIQFANNEKLWKQKVLNYAEKYALQVLGDFEAFKKRLNKR